MFISEAFKNDMLSRNTKIVPVVIIEKYISGGDSYINPETGEESTTSIVIDEFGFSTNNIELKESGSVSGVANPTIYCKPLLMGLPKLKESIAVTNGKYKISSVTLNLSNIEYNGSRVSDLFTNNLLINENVSIHLKSQSCTTITPSVRNVSSSLRKNDCAVVYVGKIRSISHTDEKVTIKLEDLTEQKIHKDLPSVILADDENIVEKYRNKPIPMVYGKLDNAPLVAEYRNNVPTFMFDYKEIHSIKEDTYISPDDYSSQANYTYGALKIFEDRYVPLLRNIKWVFVTDTDDLDNYVNVSENSIQYYTNDDNTISINESGLWLVDRVQGIYSGKPRAIDLIDTNFQSVAEDWIDTLDYLGYFSLNHLFGDVDYNKMTDGNVDTFAQASDYQTSFAYLASAYTNDGNNEIAGDWLAAHYMQFNLPYILRWEFAPSSAKYSKLLGTSINGNKLPVVGDEDFDFQGRWSATQEVLWAMPTELVNSIFEHSWGMLPDTSFSLYGFWYWFNSQVNQ